MEIKNYCLNCRKACVLSLVSLNIFVSKKLINNMKRSFMKILLFIIYSIDGARIVSIDLQQVLHS